MAKSFSLTQKPLRTIVVVDADASVLERIKNAVIPLLGSNAPQYGWVQAANAKDGNNIIQEMMRQQEPVAAIIIGTPNEDIGRNDSRNALELVRQTHQSGIKSPIYMLSENKITRKAKAAGAKQMILKNDYESLAAAFEGSLRDRGATR